MAAKPPDPKLDALFTQRLAGVSKRLDKAHDRGVQQAAIADAAISRLQRNAAESKSRLCLKATPVNGTGRVLRETEALDDEEVQACSEQPEPVSEEVEAE